MVSSFRYSCPAFIPLVLGAFILAPKYQKEEWIGYFVAVKYEDLMTFEDNGVFEYPLVVDGEIVRCDVNHFLEGVDLREKYVRLYHIHRLIHQK